MVELFKTYALELCKIRAAFKEVYGTPGKLDADETPLCTMEDATVEGFHAAMSKTVAFRERHKYELAYEDVLGEYHEASEPLRLAVAKEWEQSVGKMVKCNLLNGWLKGEDGDDEYRLLKRTNVICADDGLVTVGDTSFSMGYAAQIDVRGRWMFVPFMEGCSLEEQKAIIQAMHSPQI